MPHGTPDWGLVGPKTTTYGLDDLGEHAVRLGSPHLWDRRGDTVWLTDFRNGLEGTVPVNVPANGTVQLFTGTARQGAFCVRLASDISLMVGLGKVVPYPTISRVGFEFSFGVVGDTAYVTAQIYADDAVDEMEGSVRYDRANDLLEYLVDPTVPTWTPFAWNVNIDPRPAPSNTLKLVVDLIATPPEYVRVILNNATYSLAGIPLWPGATTTYNYLYVQIAHEAGAVGAAEIDVDNVIVTQNEP